jgi:alkylation response protein AidB-like acyl-CoA dehydrogenase
MTETSDTIRRDLRQALRASLSGLAIPMGAQGAPAFDDPSSPAAQVLARLGAADLERPIEAGGLDFGLAAGLIVSEELGRAACAPIYGAVALAAETALPHPAALAGFEALPVGDGVRATSRSFGFELTGTVMIDTVEAAHALIPVLLPEGAYLVNVPVSAPDLHRSYSAWPRMIRLNSTPLPRSQVLLPLTDTPQNALARARLRHAAYLLGLAHGAYDIAVHSVAERRQFDTRLIDMPVVAFTLARALVSLRATRALVDRAAWVADTPDADEDEPMVAVMALAMAADTARSVARCAMHLCGVRAITTELALHRYYRLTAVECARFGASAALWRQVGARRLELANGASPSVGAVRPEPDTGPFDLDVAWSPGLRSAL